MSKIEWKPGNMLYPLPTVMVSCQRENEKPNIITIGWAGTVCSNPPMVSISIRKERYSYSIIQETKEYVINLVTKDLCYANDYCGVKSGRDIDKYKVLNLHEQKSNKIKTPGIKESPVNIECVVKETLDLDHAQVCTGGISCREVSSETLESKLVPGLYFCGEILDVDGICGGYNLQWAWSSGHAAGEAAANEY